MKIVQEKLKCYWCKKKLVPHKDEIEQRNIIFPRGKETNEDIGKIINLCAGKCSMAFDKSNSRRMTKLLA